MVVCIILLLCNSTPVFAISREELNNVVAETSKEVLDTVENPQVGFIGGEWLIIGLARSNSEISQSYYDLYYKNLENYVKQCKGNLHDTKYTEYSRVVTALTAMGKDPVNVAGYNLLEPLGDFEKTKAQGINGSIFALIALDSGNYNIPINHSAKVQATREMYVNDILSKQLGDGGFALFGNTTDPEVTGMALQALSKYMDNEKVKNAVDKAIVRLSEMQAENGGYYCFGEENAESIAQMIMALCELGIDIKDSRFVKEGNTLVDNLMTFYREGEGFAHVTSDKAVNAMSTEQAFYALVNVQRIRNGQSSLYRMADNKSMSRNSQVLENDFGLEGLTGRNENVKVPPVVLPQKTFEDTVKHPYRHAITELASRRIISGVSEKRFQPDSAITRAQFAAIVVKSLGLPIKSKGQFQDVSKDSMFAPYIDTAFSYGIIQGVTANTFLPNKTITKQEAAVMLMNAAKLCGQNTEFSNEEIRDILAQFSDYTHTADWARNGLAFCYKDGILSEEDIFIHPLDVVTRADIANMVVLLLQKAELIQ